MSVGWLGSSGFCSPMERPKTTATCSGWVLAAEDDVVLVVVGFGGFRKGLSDLGILAV